MLRRDKIIYFRKLELPNSLKNIIEYMYTDIWFQIMPKVVPDVEIKDLLDGTRDSPK